MDRQVLFNTWRDKEKWRTHGNRFGRNILCWTDPNVPLYDAVLWGKDWETVASGRSLVFVGGASPTVRNVPGKDSWAAWRESG